MSLSHEAGNSYEPGRILSATDQANTMILLELDRRNYKHHEPHLLLNRESFAQGWIQSIDTVEINGFVIACPNNDKTVSYLFNLDFGNESFTGEIKEMSGVGPKARPAEVADIRFWHKRIFENCMVRPLASGEQFSPEDYSTLLPLVYDYLKI